MLSIILVVLLIIVSYFYEYDRRKHSHWRYRGVWSPKSTRFFGHLLEMQNKKRPYWEYTDQMYKDHKKSGHVGMYDIYNPVLLILDLANIKNVLNNDFDHFPTRQVMQLTGKNDKFMNEMLTNTQGNQWKQLRSRMSPVFTSGKLKSMFSLLSETADAFTSYCIKKHDQNGYVDMAKAVDLYACDVIASVAIGVDGNCLKDDDKFYNLIRNSLAMKGRMFKYMVNITFPSLFKLLGLNYCSEEVLTLKNLIQKTMDDRRSSGTKRGDFIDLMMETEDQYGKEKVDNEFKFDTTTGIAQCILFLFAGYRTISSTMSFVSNLVALHPQEQAKLRAELVELTKGEEGQLSYDHLAEAKYLDAFINECMRLYPSAYLSERSCGNSYHVPGTAVILQKGNKVRIPVYSLHRDPAYWEEPETFNPDRFLPENKDKIVPYSFMPFAAGPRNCIASRFAMLEMKIAISKLVLKYEMNLMPGFEMKIDPSGEGEMKPDSNGVKVILNELATA